MHAVCLQWVLDVGSPSVQRWKLVLPVSNACRWLTAALKCRFYFVRRFSRFIASLACSNPNACYPPLCFDFTPHFASFSVLCPIFRILHRLSLFCIVFRTPLHRFLLLASFSVPCFIFLNFHIVFRTCFTLLLACRSHCLVFPPFCFIACICI